MGGTIGGCIGVTDGCIGVTDGCIGVTDGGTMGQIIGAQMGGRSTSLEHIGCTEPLTHLHTQCALASSTKNAARTATNATTKANFRMASPNGSYCARIDHRPGWGHMKLRIALSLRLLALAVALLLGAAAVSQPALAVISKIDTIVVIYDETAHPGAVFTLAALPTLAESVIGALATSRKTP